MVFTEYDLECDTRPSFDIWSQLFHGQQLGSPLRDGDSDIYNIMTSLNFF